VGPCLLRAVIGRVAWHIPLFRATQENCTELDITPEFVHKLSEFKGDELQDGVLRYANIPNKDVMNQKSSERIMNALQPAFVFSGHNHYHCLYHHPNGVKELSVSTFSWRNRVDPSFVLATIFHEKPRDRPETKSPIQIRCEEMSNSEAREHVMHVAECEATMKQAAEDELHTEAARRSTLDEGEEEETEVEVYLKRCELPSESTVVIVYMVSLFVWLTSIANLFCRCARREVHNGWSSPKLLKQV